MEDKKYRNTSFGNPRFLAASPLE